MCMFDTCDDFVTSLGSADHTARQQHKCAECCRAIGPGEKYHADRFVFEGKLSVHKTCGHCMVARGWLQGECGGWVYGQVEEDVREHVQNGGIWGPRAYGLPVARLAVGMRQKWARPDGSLRPLPAMPLTTHERLRATA